MPSSGSRPAALAAAALIATLGGAIARADGLPGHVAAAATAGARGGPPTGTSPSPPREGAADDAADGSATPAPAPTPTPKPSQTPDPDPPPSPFSHEGTWLDVGHAFLEQRVFAPVVQLDRFFSDERELEAERSRSFLRLRTDVRFRDDGKPVFGTTVRADLHLPGLNERLERFRLVLAGQSDDPSGALYPTSENPGLAQTRTRRLAAELRYALFRGLLSRVDLGAGLLGQIPPGVFGQVRYRFAVPAGDLFLARFATLGFWRSDVHFGASQAASLERPLGAHALFRVGGRGEITQETSGVAWSSEAAILTNIGPRRAVQAGWVVTGVTAHPVAVDHYWAYVRGRRDVFRRWIFIEVEPEIGWPWDPVRHRHQELAITFRLEVQFQGNERPPVPPPSLPEPIDPPDPAEPAQPPEPPEPSAVRSPAAAARPG